MNAGRRRRFGKKADSGFSTFLSLERLEDRLLLSSYSESVDALVVADTSLAPPPTLNVAMEEATSLTADSPALMESEITLDAAQDVIDEWRVYFPTEDYVVWQKGSPWDSLDDVLQSPPSGVQLLDTIALDIGRNEYESTSFVITNLTAGNLTFDLSHDSPQIGITLRKGIWVYTGYSGPAVNEALSLIDNNQVVIASGESLEIWVTLQGNDVAAGLHEPTVTIASTGLSSHAVDLDVTVHDISLPTADQMELNTYYWDYVVPEWQDPALTQEIIQDLKNHYVNTPNMHPWPVPGFTVTDGQVVMDYTQFDQTLAAYDGLDTKVMIFEMLSSVYFEPNGGGRPPFMSTEWKTLFGSWLTQWVDHMKTVNGLGYDDFIIQPYDERLTDNVYQMHKLIKETDPQIQICLNSMGNTATTLADVTNIAPYVDVWMPFLYDYLNSDPYPNLPVKDLARQLLGPMVTESELITNGDMELVSSQNVVINGNMELGSPPVAWSPSGATLTAETTNVYEGNQSLRIENLGGQITGAAYSTGGDPVYFPIEGGVQYDFTFAYYGIDTSVYYGLYLFNSSGEPVAGTTADFGWTQNVWNTYSHSITTAADASYGYMGFFPSVAGSTVIIDDVRLVKSGGSATNPPDLWIPGGAPVGTSADTYDSSLLSISINNDGGAPYATSASQTSLPITPDTEYALTFWYKGDVRWALIDQATNQLGADHLFATEWTPYTTSVMTNAASTSMDVIFYDLDLTDRTLLIDNVSIISLESSIVNAVVNGDMEDGSPPNSWLGTGVTLSANTTDSYEGGQSLQMINNPNTQGFVEQTFAIVGGSVYQISFASKGIDCDMAYMVQSDAGGTFFGTAGSPNAWEESSFDWIAPAGATSATILFSPNGISKTGLIDNVTVTVNRPDQFWTYANPLYGSPFEPYQDYRVAVWSAWNEGMTGFGYWIYSYQSHWDSTGLDHNWSVVYRTDLPDTPAEVSTQELIVPSKRWEATREGVEDYAYLSMLRSLIDNSILAPDSIAILNAESTLEYWTQMVLNYQGTDLATQAKVALMEVIVAFPPNQIPGDANGDGVVSAGDYASVQANFGNTGVSYIPGDANGDGVVSAGDYASVQANFGNTAPATEPYMPISIISNEPAVLTEQAIELANEPEVLAMDMTSSAFPVAVQSIKEESTSGLLGLNISKYEEMKPAIGLRNDKSPAITIRSSDTSLIVPSAEPNDIFLPTPIALSQTAFMFAPQPEDESLAILAFSSPLAESLVGPAPMLLLDNILDQWELLSL